MSHFVDPFHPFSIPKFSYRVESGSDLLIPISIHSFYCQDHSPLHFFGFLRRRFRVPANSSFLMSVATFSLFFADSDERPE